MDCFRRNVLPHPPHIAWISRLAIVIKLQDQPSATQFSDHDEVKDAVKTWLQEVSGEFYNIGIQKLILKLENCIDLDGGYVEI